MGAWSKPWTKEKVFLQSAEAMLKVFSPSWCRGCADVVQVGDLGKKLRTNLQEKLLAFPGSIRNTDGFMAAQEVASPTSPEQGARSEFPIGRFPLMP